MEPVRELMLIDGKDAESLSGRWLQIENPSRRGEVFAEVPCAGAADVDIAVKAASRAFASWREVPAAKRGEILLKIADALPEFSEELGRVVATEDGNIIRYTRGEVINASEKIRYYGGLATELKGTVYPGPNGAFLYTKREPFGVTAAWMPWNSPLALSAAKIGPVLMTGNTIVLKAPTPAPVGLLRMAKIMNRFLPPGVLNVITGDGAECGEALARHPLVRKFTFTGSAEVGKRLLHIAAERVVSATVSLSGKNPQIIYPDSNQDDIVDKVIGTFHFDRMGQSCASGSILYIHRSIYDSFVERMAKKLGTMKLGDACDNSTDIGPIVSRDHFDKVCSFIDDALAEGKAKLVCGGLPPEDGPLACGYFIEPTIFTCENNDTLLAKNEIFGPVALAVPWDDETEVLKMANDTPYGLVAYVWSRDLVKAINTAHSLDAGAVIVNFLGGPTEGHPYGGMKESGIGRENCLEGILQNYTELKAVTVNMNY